MIYRTTYYDGWQNWYDGASLEEALDTMKELVRGEDPGTLVFSGRVEKGNPNVEIEVSGPGQYSTGWSFSITKKCRSSLNKIPASTV